MALFIALLRAINVGRNRQLPMKEFKAACEEAAQQRFDYSQRQRRLRQRQIGGAVKSLSPTCCRKRFA